MSLLQDVPEGLGEALGVSTAVAGLVLSCAILMSATLVLLIAGGRQMNMLLMSIPLTAIIAFLVTIAWLPYWILFVIALLIAIQLAKMFSGMTTAGKE